MTNEPELEQEGGDEADDVSYAPESGQPKGGRDNPWDKAEAGASWPPPLQAAPKDEL